jgi:Ca2+-binding RTX toxin-like protein
MAVTLESFEGLTATPNSPLSFQYGEFGFLQPGLLSPFTFASGLKLLAPIPNDNDGNGETLTGDFGLNVDATWGLDENGGVESAGDLPHGTAYIGANKEIDGTLTFGFPGDAFTVKAFVTAVKAEGQRSAVTATAYDAQGNVITASRILTSHVDDWDENLISLQSKKPIAKVVFTGDYLVLDALTFDGARPDIVNGTKKNDRIGSATAKDASDGPEVIIAKAGNDRVFARDGGDTVDGGKGNDKVHGGLGNDTLIGGLGKDKLWGDEGQDSFLFKAPGGTDRIKDFDVASDNIILDHAGFDLINRGHLPAEVFSDGSTPISSDTRIIYAASTGEISYDADGSGGKKAVLFAKLAPGLELGAEHFFVV